MNFNRPNIVIVFVFLFMIVGSFWAIFSLFMIGFMFSDDPNMPNPSDEPAGYVGAMFIILSATISHFASALVLFSGKKPKTTVIVLVIINVVTNAFLLLVDSTLIPFFVPAIIFNLVFLIFLQKNKELEKYATQIYRSPKSKPVIKPQNIVCGNCNTIADSSNKFCKKCGTRI